MQVLQPGEIPIVNRSGGTISAGSLARIVDRDSVASDFWEVAQPNAANQRNICVVPEDLPDDAKGMGLLLDHPRVLKHSVGASLAAGDWLGTESGSWQAAAGNTLLVWSCNSTEATATFVGQPISAGSDIASVGSANAAGDSGKLAHSNHVHQGVHSVIEDDAIVYGNWTLAVTQNLTIETAGNTTTITGPNLSSYLTSVTTKLVKIVSGGGTGAYSAYVVKEINPSSGAEIGSDISSVYIKDDSAAIPAATIVGPLLESPAGVKYCWPFAIVR